MSSRKVLLSIAVAWLLAGPLAGFLYGLDSTPTRTSTSISTTTVRTVPDAYDQVASTYADHLLLLEARNASAVASQYETDATIEWKGVSGGCDGNYTGNTDITKLLADLLTRSSSLLVSNETQTIRAEGNIWVVNSTFNFMGNSAIVGIFEGSIAGQDIRQQRPNVVDSTGDMELPFLRLLVLGWISGFHLSALMADLSL
jgi:hypothetical protein